MDRLLRQAGPQVNQSEIERMNAEPFPAAILALALVSVFVSTVCPRIWLCLRDCLTLSRSGAVLLKGRRHFGEL